MDTATIAPPIPHFVDVEEGKSYEWSPAAVARTSLSATARAEEAALPRCQRQGAD